MFKDPIDSFTNMSKPKSSVQKKLIKTICEQFPVFAPHLEEVVPKGSKLTVTKIKGVSHIQIIANDESGILFIQLRDK